MKKLIIPILLMLCMIIPATAQFLMPYPVHGIITLNDDPMSGLEVSFTNVRTVETLTTLTNDIGEYHIELTDLKEGYRYGDTVYVEGCKGYPDCSVSFEIEGGSKRLDFPITDITVQVLFKGIWVTSGELQEAYKIWWFAGFLGLVTYWYRRKEKTGKKMLITFFKRLRAGKYKK